MIFAFSLIKILLNFAEVLILNSSELASYFFVWRKQTLETYNSFQDISVLVSKSYSDVK